MSDFLKRMGFQVPSTNKGKGFSLSESIPVKSGVVNYPQLNVKVFFAGRCFFGGAVRMFQAAGCEPTNDIEEAGLVVFLGGADIDPALYGDKQHPTTSYDPNRDEQEIEIFLQAQALGIPMFGICRGMQFLHAMAGGVLWQNVRNHAGSDHRITDLFSGETMMSTSLHHQMCIYNGPRRDGTVWCVPAAKCSTTLSGLYEAGRSDMTSQKEMELEAAYYPVIKAFATQGHPELLKYDDYTAWCLTKIEAVIKEAIPHNLPDNVEQNTGPWIPEDDIQLRAEVARTIG